MPIINVMPPDSTGNETKQGISEVSDQLNNDTYGLSAMQKRTGETSDTGGTTTSGSIFAKLNAVLQQFTGVWTSSRATKLDLLDNSTYGLNAIKSAVNSVKSVNSRYTPIPTLQKTLLNTEMSHDNGRLKLIAKFMPEKDGVMILRYSIKAKIYDVLKEGHIEMGVVDVSNLNAYPTAFRWGTTGEGYNIRYENHNVINFNTLIGTVRVDEDSRSTICLNSVYETSYKTMNTLIQVVKGIPIMIYLSSSGGNTAYCNLVQLLYEEV